MKKGKKRKWRIRVGNFFVHRRDKEYDFQIAASDG